MRQVRTCWIGAAHQSPGGTHQIRYPHIGHQRIAARPRHFSLYVHAWWIEALRLAVHQDAVARLDQNVVQWIAGQRLAQRDAENFRGTVRNGTVALTLPMLPASSLPPDRSHRANGLVRSGGNFPDGALLHKPRIPAQPPNRSDRKCESCQALAAAARFPDAQAPPRD